MDLGMIIKRNFHCPCRFRAVSAALHGISRVRSHLPQANYIKLRLTMVSNPTLSAITCSDENFDIDPPTRYTKALQNLRIDPGRLVSKLLDIFNIGARIHSGIAVRAALTAQFEHT